MKYKTIKDFKTDQEFIEYYESLSREHQIKYLLKEFETMVLDNDKFNRTLKAPELVLLCMDAFLTQTILSSLTTDGELMTQLTNQLNGDNLDKEDKDDEPTWN